MDSIIRRYEARADADLILAEHHGVAYQRDMSERSTNYGNEYLVKVQAYEGTHIANAVNAGRVAFMLKHLAPGSAVLDYGAGTGDFMRAASADFRMSGFEIIPAMREKLIAEKKYAETARGFQAVTFWDVLEHLETPAIALRRVERDALVFCSLPCFVDLNEIRKSRHYRPGEHLYYWTVEGFIEWMDRRGFRILETSRHEMMAGRDSVVAFAFKKDVPDYNDYLAAYREMHINRHYGYSATAFLDEITDIVRRHKPNSVLDYGCGRSDLVAHFWLDGERRLGRYDPAIERYETMPDGVFDMAVCLDVLEHVPIAAIDRVLGQLKEKSNAVIFTISTALARARLPDGRNAHCTILRRGEWVEWLRDYWGAVEVLPTNWENEMMVLAGSFRR